MFKQALGMSTGAKSEKRGAKSALNSPILPVAVSPVHFFYPKQFLKVIIAIGLAVSLCLGLSCAPAYVDQDRGKKESPAREQPTNTRSGDQKPSQQPPPPVTVEYGKAAFLADDLRGKSTSSGELYDPGKLTAAHLTLPFGTICRVTNMTNGKMVEVRINDRFAGTRGRIILISHEAASRLDAVRAGVIEVKVEVLKKPAY